MCHYPPIRAVFPHLVEFAHDLPESVFTHDLRPFQTWEWLENYRSFLLLNLEERPFLQSESCPEVLMVLSLGRCV